MTTVGDRIRQIRKHLGLNQDQFSKEIGTIQSYLSEIETNKKIPSEKLIRAIAYRWGYSLTWLLEGQEQSQSPGPELSYGSAESDADSARPSEIFEERRAFNRESGLARDEAEILANWLARDQEVKKLLVEWAKARLSGALSGTPAELLEVETKAKAQYLLSTVQKRDGKKEPPPGG